LSFDIGDAVWWISVAGPSRIERAGYVAAIVPPGELAADYVPSDMVSKFYGTTPRSHASYVIRVPDIEYAFWPQVAALQPLTSDKEHVLESQPKSNKHFFLKKSQIDTTDRKELLFIIQSVFKESCKETAAHIEVPGWKKRFWFKVTNGEEHICHVDAW